MEKKRNIKVILIVGLIVLLVGVIGVTFAFFSTGGMQETANTFQSGCLNISLTDASSSINLSNIYPITDIEGLDGTSYDFTITNTCSTDANYQINLESIKEQTDSLNADYIKVSLSSNTVDNVISILGDNTSVTPEVDGAYEAYNLYTGTLSANEEKTYHLKLWLDYDATKEVAANKTYSSKINVVANPEIQVTDDLEATFAIDGTTLTSTLTNNVTSATYCTTTDNICNPTTSTTISNNSYIVELEGKEEAQMVCTKLNGASKVICSNPLTIKLSPSKETLAKLGLTVSEGTPDFSKTAQASCNDNSTCEETNGIYKGENDYGTTYYWRGAVDNNWVSFAGFYWRIIRINGDGTIRLIYTGTSSSSTSDDTIGTSTFSINSSTYNDNDYVGYMYTIGSLRGTSDESGIKKVLDNWYIDNIENEEKNIHYGQYIDGNAGFCGDRTPSTSSSSSNGQGGIETTTTYYGSYIRLYTNKSPNFKCTNMGDLYTTVGSNDGNQALDYPIGLITADEVAFAGGVSGINNYEYYLKTSEYSGLYLHVATYLLYLQWIQMVIYIIILLVGLEV